MMNEKEVARRMSEEVGFEIDEKLVTKLPDDGTPDHMGSGHWDVFAARAGEFVVLAYAYDSGEFSITIN